MTGLLSSIFCQSPAADGPGADGSVLRAGSTVVASMARPVITGSTDRNLATAVHIHIT